MTCFHCPRGIKGLTRLQSGLRTAGLEVVAPHTSGEFFGEMPTMRIWEMPIFNTGFVQQDMGDVG